MAKKTLKMPDTTAPAKTATPMQNMISGMTPKREESQASGCIRRTISVDPNLYKKIKLYAAENDTSISGFLSKLATDYFKANNI